MDEKEFAANDDKFEEHIAKINEYTASLKPAASSAYTREMDRTRGNERNYSVKSRMMDMRKAVNHPYLIEYPISECGTFYDSSEDMIDICGKLQVGREGKEKYI